MMAEDSCAMGDALTIEFLEKRVKDLEEQLEAAVAHWNLVAEALGHSEFTEVGIVVSDARNMRKALEKKGGEENAD